MNVKRKVIQQDTFEAVLPGTVFLHGTLWWLKTKCDRGVCLSDGNMQTFSPGVTVIPINGYFIEE